MVFGFLNWLVVWAIKRVDNPWMLLDLTNRLNIPLTIIESDTIIVASMPIK